MTKKIEEITFIIITITPEMAEAWLAKNNPNNRVVVKTHVASMAAEIEAGKFQLTHQPIAFAPDGSLADGQHRLHAIVLAKKPVRMVVAHYASNPPAGMDRGKQRTWADELVLSGRVQKSVSGRVAASCAAIGNALRGYYSYPSRSKLNELYASYGRDVEAVLPHFGRRMSGLIVGAFAYAYPVAPQQVEAFATKMTTKIGFQEGDPEYLLNKYLEHSFSAKSLENKNEHRAAFDKVLRCIQAKIEGEHLGKLQAGRGDESVVRRYFDNKRKLLGLPTG